MYKHTPLTNINVRTVETSIYMYKQESTFGIGIYGSHGKICQPNFLSPETKLASYTLLTKQKLPKSQHRKMTETNSEVWFRKQPEAVTSGAK